MTADRVNEYLAPLRDRYPESRALLLPALKYAQTEKGWLDLSDLEAVAEATGLTAAYVESVASFYDRLYLRPTGNRIVSVCVTLSCMLRGSDQLLERMCDVEGLGPEGGTSEDGGLTIQTAQCLGYCDKAPCVQVDAEETEGPIPPERAEEFLAKVRASERPAEMWR